MRRLHDVQHVAIFAANINESLVRADRATGDDHAFDQLVRIHFHQRTILAGARLDSSALQITYLALGESLRHEATTSCR